MNEERAGQRRRDLDREFFEGLGRAFGGALLFAVPLFMTMEMWFLGMYLSRVRLAVFTLVGFSVLIGLARTIGFKKKEDLSWREAVVDAAVAYLVGFVTSAAVLTVMSVIGGERGWRIASSIVALEAIPAALGAAFARSSMGGGDSLERERERFSSELFITLAGAAVFSFNLAPTEEMILIAYRMTSLDAGVLALVSLALLHALVYTLGFAGSSRDGHGFVRSFFVFTLTGYAGVLLVSAYLLWTFGRFDGSSLPALLGPVVVLGFPATLGAGAARLIL